MKIVTVLFISRFLFVEGGRLSISNNKFVLNNQSIFLSGVNFAWNYYGYDFGNGQYTSSSKMTFLSWLDQVATNGGNTIRVWLHVEGYNTPTFNSSGYVTAPDSSGTMLTDMRSFLDAAKTRNILVIIVLWNGASLSNRKVLNLFTDTAKLQSYIDKALKPMVKNLSGHPALAAWEIINEPEGLVSNNQANSNPCYDTKPLMYTGAGWSNKNISMYNILRFINWQSDAIHATDLGVLVTVGSFSEHSQTGAFWDCRNYMTDACLTSAGGRKLGIIDFYQMHSYSWNNQFGTNAPFRINASQYALTKPLVIGEYAAACAAGMTTQQLVNWAYNRGYQGILSWQYVVGENAFDCSDKRSIQDIGLQQLKGKNSAGGVVNFILI